jgi:hypothetical protein
MDDTNLSHPEKKVGRGVDDKGVGAHGRAPLSPFFLKPTSFKPSFIASFISGDFPPEFLIVSSISLVKMGATRLDMSGFLRLGPEFKKRRRGNGRA